jgi:hypothetical protein
VLAYAASLVMLVAMLLLALPPTRWLLLKLVLPAPGQGPDRQTVVNGFFKLKFVGFTALGPNATGAPRRIAASVEGKRDPGYGWTARCITECALALLNRKECRIGADGRRRADASVGHWLVAVCRIGARRNDVHDRRRCRTQEQSEWNTR